MKTHNKTTPTMQPMKHHTKMTPTMHTMKLQDLSTDDFMAMIRAANQPNTARKTKSEITDGPRKSVDVYCDACGRHGHCWHDCDFLAIIINSLKFLDSLDQLRKRAYWTPSIRSKSGNTPSSKTWHLSVRCSAWKTMI
jgi:hypothetical protein